MNNGFLEDWQREAVHYIERTHNTSGAVPSDDDILKYLQFLKYELTLTNVNNLKNNPLFQASMKVRGIVINTEESGQLRETKGLTSRQIAAAAVMLNLTDRRSDEKKLRDIGVSTEEFSTWMQNNEFAEYMRQRSELLVSNSIHEAHMGLLRGVRQGNTASIKLYYELTGRYNPNEENQVNIRLLIGKMLEVIQAHVKDPNVLNALAVDFSQLAIEAGSPVANTPIVPSESTRKELA
jgi:hypothetical protein